MSIIIVHPLRALLSPTGYEQKIFKKLNISKPVLGGWLWSSPCLLPADKTKYLVNVLHSGSPDVASLSPPTLVMLPPPPLAQRSAPP